MLTKLLRRDLRALFPWYAIAYGAMLLVAGVYCLSLHASMALQEGATLLDEFLFLIATLSTAGSLLLLFLLFATATALSTYLPAVIFYKNYLHDEGYLMMTLPVTRTQLLLSKLIAAVLGVYATAVVSVLTLSIVLLAIPGFGGVLEQLGPVLDQLLRAITSGSTLSGVLLIALLVLLLLLSPVMAMLTFYTAFLLGQRTGKHRLLWSILFYFILQTAISLIMQIGQLPFQILVALLPESSLRLVDVYLIYTAVSLLFVAALSIFGFLFTKKSMEKHLDLE